MAGIRVLEVGNYMAGPFCAMQLADLGADVVKVESPAAGGDEVRRTGPKWAWKPSWPSPLPCGEVGRGYYFGRSSNTGYRSAAPWGSSRMSRAFRTEPSSQAPNRIRLT
jgi:CoA-transferase family III